MRIRTFAAAAAVVAAGLFTTAAVNAADTGAQEKEIAARIFSTTGMKVDKVTPAPIEGLWEVFMNRRVFYVDKSTKYLIVGRIFDTKTETDLTAERMKELSRVDWKTLPLNDAIKVTYGNGERKVVVFTDARCTYCSMLERNLQAAGNVTVYNFIYSILNSKEMARDIVCSKNPASAWQAHMLDGTEPAKAADKCDASVLDRNLALGEKFGFTSTPSIIFADGTIVQGALPTEDLNVKLSAKRP